LHAVQPSGAAAGLIPGARDVRRAYAGVSINPSETAMNNPLKAVTLALLLLPALAYALPAAPADGRVAEERDSASDCACEVRTRRPVPQASASFEPYAEQDGAFRDVAMDGKVFRR
jgi:hypothetical protein